MSEWRPKVRNPRDVSVQPSYRIDRGVIGRGETFWASPDYNKDAFWSTVMVSTEKQVKDWLNGFDIISFREHRTTGKSVGGQMHDWNIFSVVARQQANQ